MKKHQFVKADCNCPRRATYFTCIHCGAIEYAGKGEIERLSAYQATCLSQQAPEATPTEVFRGKIGGTFNCLSPDWDTKNVKATSDKPESSSGVGS